VVIVHVGAVELESAGVPGAGNQLVQAVDRAKKRRFAAAGRSNERGDGARPDCQRDVEERLRLPVPKREIMSRDGAGPDVVRCLRCAVRDRRHPNRPVM
jgi:hypothetical protein